jgi:hypothetical protein
MITDGLPTGGSASGSIADKAFVKAKAAGVQVLFVLIGTIFTWLPLPTHWYSEAPITIGNFGALEGARDSIVELVCTTVSRPIVTTIPTASTVIDPTDPPEIPVTFPPVTPPTKEPTSIKDHFRPCTADSACSDMPTYKACGTSQFVNNVAIPTKPASGWSCDDTKNFINGEQYSQTVINDLRSGTPRLTMDEAKAECKKLCTGTCTGFFLSEAYKRPPDLRLLPPEGHQGCHRSRAC